MHPKLSKPLVWLFVILCFLVQACFGLAATKKPPIRPINLNAATSEELQQVPGIGPATADKILQMRKSYGAFKTVDDLLAIRGIGKKRLDKMRKYLVAGRAAPAVRPSAAGKSQSAKLGKPASCPGCAKKSPPKKVSLSAKSITKSTAPAEKPVEAPAATEPDEEPQRR